MSCHPNSNQFIPQPSYPFDPNMTLFYSQTPPAHGIYQQQQQQPPFIATAVSSPTELQSHPSLQHRSSFQQQSALLQQQQMMYHHHQAMQLQEHHPLLLHHHQHQQQQDQHQPSSPNNKKAQSKAERRAEHNAIERARRESLNTKFQQLAHSLPNLQNDRRPSKGTIIERTLEFVKQTIQKEEQFRTRISKLQERNEQLRRQIKTWSEQDEEDSQSMSVPDFPDDHFSCKSSHSSSSVSSSAAMSSIGQAMCPSSSSSSSSFSSSSSLPASMATTTTTLPAGPTMITSPDQTHLPTDSTTVSPVVMGLPLQSAWPVFSMGHDANLLHFHASASPCEEDEGTATGLHDEIKSPHVNDHHHYHALFSSPEGYTAMTKMAPMTDYQVKYESYLHHA
ncbi:hypothetical protein EC973_008422 [Apophysomyces ossiformis]|uniref:BHLH domain-containing protein n=1 Tax=Apophysomyces ossiformis TaxID=679940 RepID=A0A8H7BSY3_9FUNG|nr:hypothetical protein EC973_008422 [Apophysomyces ossiformis]